MGEELKIEEAVRPRSSVMIIGLSGWGNAGEVSTFTVRYLIDKLGAERIGKVSSEGFYNYQIQRPIVSIKGGIIESYNPPTNELYYCEGKAGGDGEISLILLLGSEPHLNWPRYAQTLLKLAERLNVKRIYTIGGYLADVDHESEPHITATTNNSNLTEELKRAEVKLTDYTGPTSIYSEVLWQAKRKGLDVISLWCAVPIYVRGPYPKAAYHVLRKLLHLIGIKLDLRDLKRKAVSSEVQITAEAMSDPELRRLVESLRRQRALLEKEPSYMI